MDITVNNQSRTVTQGQTLADLINDMKLDAARIAVEYNRDILTREQLAEVSLKEGDTIEIVNFVGGG
ncbi:sulfur carrier protein ThiS [Desulfuromonas acetoxidans]|uniref:Thiamine biosynthesis protein ThiS n=1 Tax=Desulfuromonas acetoxidans (strain DSM 684 / 11070) TaxID=281689 RepID=Q1JYF4_DESA6|nr:sulfur carrier protein ThiS [Desulfuromonas acetoxidans]EAT15252.1 thiamine biosynthesis protein ThiS [Desulfuromonas acetoxidans DSM 684]MBF0645362.1 sulfur carrier protein ThiS [Desulfuromonas acetoxidans]NVD23442.1 sulfur carrier protein ThiS [Desulfuromonas acetoxidans]